MGKLEAHLKRMDIQKRLKQREILNWAKVNGRLPVRHSKDSTEKTLAGRLHNYISPTADSFDASFRKEVSKKFPIGFRKKRKHNPERRKNELLKFIQDNGRVPYNVGKEGRLGSLLSAFTCKHHNMYDSSVADKVKELDSCHLTRIPKKYRRSINESLDKSKVELKSERTVLYLKR